MPTAFTFQLADVGVHLVELGHVVDGGVEVHQELLGEDVPGDVRVQVGVPAGGNGSLLGRQGLYFVSHLTICFFIMYISY